MSKIDCSMRIWLGRTAYCDYYDAGCVECFGNKNCPEEEDEEYYSEEDENEDY